MLSDPRAKTKIREFLFTWLNANAETDIGKDGKKFPGFDPAIAFDMRTSLELFLDQVVWSEDSDFRKLLLSEEVYLNDRLAQLGDARGDYLLHDALAEVNDPVYFHQFVERAARHGLHYLAEADVPTPPRNPRFAPSTNGSGT